MLYKVLLEGNNEHIATPNVHDEPLREGEWIPLRVDGEEAQYLVTKIEPKAEMLGDTLVVGTVWVRRETSV